MSGALVDSNVILDILLDDPVWASWSIATLEEQSAVQTLHINAIIYTEISIGFERIEDLEAALQIADFEMLDLRRETLFLAGKAFQKYRWRRGQKTSPLPDFYIGAQAAVRQLTLITRDAKRFQTYYPTLQIITPSQ